MEELVDELALFLGEAAEEEKRRAACTALGAQPCALPLATTTRATRPMALGSW